MSHEPPSTEPTVGDQPVGLMFELWLIKQAIYRLIEDMIHETGLSADQYGMLLLVDRLQPISPGDVARHCGMRANTASAALGRLEGMSLLDRQSNESDARSVLVSLSDAGREVMTRAIELAESAIERIAPLVDGLAVAIAVSELNRAFRTLAVLPLEAPRRQPDVASSPGGHVMFDMWLMKQAIYPLIEQPFGPRGISADDIGLELFIERMEPVTPGEITRYTGMRPNNLSSALGRLERKGHVERKRNEKDARSVLVSLTDEGRACTSTATEQFEGLYDRLGSASFMDEASRRLAELNTAIRSAARLPAIEPSASIAGA